MTPGFDIAVPTSLGAGAAFAAATAWPEHGRHVPLTRVTTTLDAGGLGDEFVGRTGVGRLGFDDPMRVVRWDPPVGGGPGSCEVLKLGRVVRGGAVLEVTPTASGSVVRWTEQASSGPPWLARLTAPAVEVGGGLVFTRVLRRLLRDAERARPDETA